MYPGKLKYVEISQKKTTNIAIGKSQWNIVHVKNGYEISNGQKNYFLATGENYQTNSKTIIYAPWLEGTNRKYALTKGAFSFNL